MASTTMAGKKINIQGFILTVYCGRWGGEGNGQMESSENRGSQVD